jgi:hypothetical protein
MALHRLEPGGTAECRVCGTTVLLVSGPAVALWCHGTAMRAAGVVRCSDSAGPRDAGGLIAGAVYADPGTSAVLRCTRSGSGWPTSQAGALAPARAC